MTAPSTFRKPTRSTDEEKHCTCNLPARLSKSTSTHRSGSRRNLDLELAPPPWPPARRRVRHDSREQRPHPRRQICPSPPPEKQETEEGTAAAKSLSGHASNSKAPPAGTHAHLGYVHGGIRRSPVLPPPERPRRARNRPDRRRRAGAHEFAQKSPPEHCRWGTGEGRGVLLFRLVTTSSLSSLARLPWGSSVAASTGENASTVSSAPILQLYEFEACPFCRRVREAMTELDISAEVYPCPKGSLSHRDVVRKIGGKEQFPLLVDASTGVTMYESGDIVKYLFRQSGEGKSPSFGLLESTILTGWVPTLLRAGRGMTFWGKAGALPAEKLELFSFENNSYARFVREALCELELPYVLQNVGEGSSKMDSLLKVAGSKQVPYLIDPNTGFQSGDHKKILSYLFQRYSVSS